MALFIMARQPERDHSGFVHVLPEARNKPFIGCYSEDTQEQHPDLRPFHRPKGLRPGERNDEKPFGGKNPAPMEDMLPPEAVSLQRKRKNPGIEAHTATVEEGWDRQCRTKQEACDRLIPLSRHPGLVNMEVLRKNADSFLHRCHLG